MPDQDFRSRIERLAAEYAALGSGPGTKPGNAFSMVSTALYDVMAAAPFRDETRERAEALHFQRPFAPGDFIPHGAEPRYFTDRCDHCRTAYPCETMRALDPEDD